MTFSIGFRRLATAAAATAFLAASPYAYAQDVPESHIKAARAALVAIHATKDFDDILGSLAQTIKNQLIQQNPDLQALISRTVDEQTLIMVPRRVDLEKEIALVYARSFSEAELNAITQFYTSEAGAKLISAGPIASRQMQEAVKIWENGVARDLTLAVAVQLEKVVGAMAPSAETGGTVAPVTGTDGAAATDGAATDGAATGGATTDGAPTDGAATDGAATDGQTSQ